MAVKDNCLTPDIFEKKEIAHQREHFANLSANSWHWPKPSTIRRTYLPGLCPMKKGLMFVANPLLKNPYYGMPCLPAARWKPP